MAKPLQLEAAAPPGAGDLAGLLGGDLAHIPELVRALLDATPARVIVIGADEHLAYANDGFFSFTRLHPKQVLGRHIAEIIGAEADDSCAPVRAALDRGETVRWEGWTSLAGVGPHYMREHLVPCVAVPGQARRGTVVMSLDLTALKQREAKLSAKVEQLQNTEALKSSIADHALAGIVSSDAHGHIVEFNPAAEAMFGYTRDSVLGRPVSDILVPQRHRAGHAAGMQRMREGAAPRLMGRRVEMPARRIREAAERCGRTFLNMARQRPGAREAVQLNDLVRAAAEVLGYTLRSHGIRLVLALDESLPAVHADGDQLGQIVLNLLINAQQALAGASTADAEVRISSGQETARGDSPGRERIWLRVADNGPGVGDELRERLFEAFFTTKPEGVGTGLGLAVSRSIAHGHGGDLVLEPATAAGGACFRLSLPPSGQREAGHSAAMPLAPVTPPQARVLVVDDEPELAAMLREMLESAGCDVAVAESGAVALALLAEARFDAIVCDLHMPDVDGAALWREVRVRHPRLARRMLFVTGDTLSAGVRQFLDSARCDALAKPFSKAALLARVTARLSSAATS
jgi:PAS domain S-box-containing protein